MYSYEDRIRAVKLYIKFGKRIRPTIRQLGYPTKNSLKDWYQQHEQVVIYERAITAQGRSIPSNRYRRQFNITLTTIVALLQP